MHHAARSSWAAHCGLRGITQIVSAAIRCMGLLSSATQAGSLRGSAGAVAVCDCADRVCVPLAAVWQAIRVQDLGLAKAP